MDTEGLREQLRANIDAEYEREIAGAKAERQRKYDALNVLFSSLPPLTLQDSPVSPASITPLVAPLPESNGQFSDNQNRFRLKEAITNLINELDEQAEFSMPFLHVELKKRFKEMREHPNPANLRAQISTNLGKLTESGVIEVVKKGTSSIPHIYRKKRQPDAEIMRMFTDERPELAAENS